MSSPALSRRPLQRLGLVGIGSAVLLVGVAPPALAATDVVIPLEPSSVALTAFPVENLGGAMDPMDPGAGVFTPVPVQYSGTVTVDLPAELDGSGAVNVQLIFEDGNGDGAPDATYDSTDLAVVPSAGSVTVTLPADDPVAGDVADLLIEPVTTTLGPAYTFFDPIYYNLGFVPTGDPAAPVAATVAPELAAFSQVPCDITSGQRCPFPTPVTVGSAVTLDLTAGSALRELGLTDLTGVQVGLQQLDGRGFPTGAAPVELTAEVSADGQTASVVVPAGTAPGAYSLVVAQETPSGGISVFTVEITVIAQEAVVPSTAAPTSPEPTVTVVNAGLRSNTGVEAVETGSTGTVAIAAGAGMLVLAGVGGVAVARTRRRPAAEGGTCA
ncbi:hypothetical protein [Geodermatophilus chilensis]|uniref:hypothetical protein n=1 Tax=Geodermatophilus chilensis TaxID=2035835 RepID=UPI000C258343|nr:hypothetical protein [Geodermatophilus chilensis]